MIPRFSGASSLSQTVVPCNLTLTILSVGPNHLNHHLNQSKCKYQCITRKKSPVQPTYNINETPLESCDTEKDLGVWVSSNLTSDKQVTEQCAKANKLLGFVRRDSRYIQSTQTRRTLYLSIVRCHLGYATQVWSPQSIGLLKRVENVQRRATKLILKLPFRFDVTYNTRLQLTNLLPISYWHEFLDIVFFYKAVNNLVFIDSEALSATRQSTRSTRSSSSNAITYIPKRSRTVLINAHFSYARAAHGLSCPLSYTQVTYL